MKKIGKRFGQAKNGTYAYDTTLLLTRPVYRYGVPSGVVGHLYDVRVYRGLGLEPDVLVPRNCRLIGLTFADGILTDDDSTPTFF